MKIKLNIQGSIKDVLRLKGVPLGLLNTSFTIDTANAFNDLTIETESGTVGTKAKDQALRFLHIIEKTPSDPAVYVFTSRHSYMKARAIGLLAFARFVEENDAHQWVVCNTSYKPLEIKKGGVLALDSISDDMSPYKRDKAHDLCQEHCGRPIIVLHHGNAPYETCIDQLGIKPSVIFNTDRTISKSAKKVRTL